MLNRFLFITLSVFISGAAFAQNNEVSEIVQKINMHSREHLREKVFVHTDKENYLTNEIVWLKAYCLEDITHAPIALSRVLYVEIIGEGSKVQGKIEMVNGKGDGSLQISTLPTGTYTLRAYTRWMRNLSSEYFFEKRIYIVNPKSVADDEVEKPNQKFTLEFFPEGGNMVEDISSVVAFKMSDNEGHGVWGKGVILNERNDTVVQFQPLKFGIGKFFFKPQKGMKYHAILNVNELTFNADFPEVLPGGYVMLVEPTSTPKITITVLKSITDIKSDYVILLAHTRQQVKVAMVAYFKDHKAVFTVDKNKLGEGVSHFTIFDNTKTPICERLFFRRPEQLLTIRGKPSVYLFAQRESVEVELSTSDFNGKPTMANMSLSVYALDSASQTVNGVNIVNSLYLQSDLAGLIEEPDYYFSERDEHVVEATDNLMLSQGWRKFDWADVLRGNKPALKFSPEYEGHVIAGSVKNQPSNNSIDTLKVFLSSSGEKPIFRVTKTDEAGAFQFVVPKIYGENPLVFQAEISELPNSLTVENSFDSRISSLAQNDNLLSRINEEVLEKNTIHTQIERVFADRFFLSDRSDSVPFYGKPDVSYALDDYVRFPTIEDSFREYMPSVIVRNAGRIAKVYVLNTATQTFFAEEPLILVDGVPLFNTGSLLKAKAKEIKKISLVQRRYYLGSVAFSGIMDVRSYSGNLAGFELDPGAIVVDYEGIQRQRKFSAPDYSVLQNKNDRTPDFRSVLTWMPNINTNALGKEHVSFFTSDKKGSFVGVIQGSTGEGLVGTHVFNFTVK